jgi:hypothetical protein
MPAESVPKKGTNQFMRQGHTATDAYGNNPSSDAKGKAAQPPRELKP